MNHCNQSNQQAPLSASALNWPLADHFRAEFRGPTVRQRVRRILASGLLALLIPVFAAAEWPVKEFEVFVGHPTSSDNSLVQSTLQGVGTAIDMPAEPTTLLRPEVRKDIETFLREVAEVLEDDFPPPLWNDPVTRSDGQRALRLYYFDFDMVESADGVRSDTRTLAGYVSDCGPGNDTILINAKQFLNNYGESGLSAKNYGDLAHELFHAVQAATIAGDPCTADLGDWATEGQAEAFGHDMARQVRGVTVSNQQTRWGLRSYHQPLYVVRNQTNGKDQSYQTASFWRYLAERHALRQAGKSGANAMPGPDSPSEYVTDYGYLATMLDLENAGTGNRAAMNWLDVGLEVEFNQGLRRTFAEFAAVYAQYGMHRVRSSLADKRARWINAGLAGNPRLKGSCERLELGSSLQMRDARVTLELEPNSAGCIELVVGNTLGPQPWIVQSTSPTAALARQLAMGIGGGQQLHTSAPLDMSTGPGVTASWLFSLDSNATQYLVVANVADSPGETGAQLVKLRLTLTGHKSPPPSRPPPKRQAPVKTTGKPAPGPAGAAEAGKQRVQQRQIGPDGVNSVTWSRVEPSGCGRNASRMSCEGGMSIRLGMDGGLGDMMMPYADAMGGMLTDMMAVGAGFDPDNPSFMATMRALEAYETWASETPGASIELEIPGVDYGFSGMVSQVGVTVSGNNGVGQRYAASTRPATAMSPCSYPPATGTVVIEEFSREVIRGRFQAPLVEIPYVNPGHQERCKTLSVVQRIDGAFVLAAPWLADDREPVDFSWVEADMMGDLAQMLPGSELNDLDLPNNIGAHAAGPDGNSGGYKRDALGELDDLDINDCNCSCAAQEQSQALVENMADTGQLPETAEAFKALMCMQICLAQGQACN